MTASVMWLAVASTDDFRATGCEAIACAATGIVTAARCSGSTAVAMVTRFEAVTATMVRALIATGLEATFATTRCKAALLTAKITAWFEAAFGTEITATFRTTFKARCRCTTIFKAIATTFESITAAIAFKARRTTRFKTVTTAVAAEATAAAEWTTATAAVTATTA